MTVGLKIQIKLRKEYAEKGLPERRILNALANKDRIHMKDLSTEKRTNWGL